MKILKYVFLLLLLVFIALTVFIATQEGKYDIKEERVIKVPKTILFNYINDYRNWENVGVLTDNDTTAIFKFYDTTAGPGAKASWTVNNAEGELVTLKTIATDSIFQKAVIDGQPSSLTWIFKDTTGGTKVSVRMKGSLSFTDKAYTLLKGNIGEKFEKSLDAGLENLNTFLERELSTYTIEAQGVVQKRGVFYLKQSAVTTREDSRGKINEMLSRLRQFTQTNKIVTNGAPFTIYTQYNRQSQMVNYSVCLPIKDEIFTMPGSDIEGGKLEPFAAFKVTLKGDYSHLPKAWDKGHRQIAEKALGENTSGQYIEVYTRNPDQTKKPSEWVTDVYLPIGQPAALPATETVPLPLATPVRETLPANRPAVTQPVRPAPQQNNSAATRPPASNTNTTPRTTRPVTTQQNNTVPQPARTTPTPVEE